MGIDVDGLEFEFPSGWEASKYDEWSWYRLRFMTMWNGIKAVDLLALDPKHTLWLVEVKDYRRHPRTKPTDLADEVAHKTFDTLAALLPVRVNGVEPGEVALATKALAATKIRVVLHLEQPAKHSKLRPRAIDPASVKQSLRRLLKPIDAHPVVVEKDSMAWLPWTVIDSCGR